jgi:threonine dehydratase
MRDHLDEMYTVSESAIVETVATVFSEDRILLEGACAPPFAILDRLADRLAGQTVVVPVTGRNLPREKLDRVLARATA